MDESKTPTSKLSPRRSPLSISKDLLLEESENDSVGEEGRSMFVDPVQKNGQTERRSHDSDLCLSEEFDEKRSYTPQPRQAKMAGGFAKQ